MYRIYTAAVAILLAGSVQAQEDVKYSGAMSNVMKKGNLHATISIDSISGRLHLYGIGPVEYLKGELIIVDGHAYKATVRPNKLMEVTETYMAKAPFFVYTHVAEWKEYTLPETVTDIAKLEAHLNAITKDAKRPFAFRLVGTIPAATIHVTNLPGGTVVKKPADTQKGKTYYQLKDTDAEIVGFFSTKHQSIFTHHNSYTHMHLITADKTKMGHLDKLTIKPGSIKLYLPF